MFVRKEWCFLPAALPPILARPARFCPPDIRIVPDLSFYLLLLQLAGAVTLLLWAVRMVRTGVERAHEPALRRALRSSGSGLIKAAGMGTVIAILLQSSTAVAILAAGFAGQGILSVGTGLALMLGADLGSALVVQILSFDLSGLIPVLLIAGGVLFFKSRNRNWRQSGRILLGVALILVSLGMISAATQPLRGSEVLPMIIGYLKGDFVTAFLLAAAFTWLAHSSIASVLLIATFAAEGIVPLELGISLVLGANLGGGLIAAALTRSMVVEARRIAVGNLIFRGTVAVIVLFALQLLKQPLDTLGGDVARQLINLHLAFNLVLVVLCIPLVGIIEKLVVRFVNDPANGEKTAVPAEAASALDYGVINSPGLALASATREIMRMAEMIEIMLQPLLEIYETGDREKIKATMRLEKLVDRAQLDIKLYLAKINFPEEDCDEARRGKELSHFTINLEYVGDAVTKTLMRLAEVKHEKKLSFSEEGWRELSNLHHRVMANMQLALNVLISRDRVSARQLLEEKDRMRSAEHKSYGSHLQRLQHGTVKSIETSNIHLETVRTLKMINSLYASIAYSILSESGDLLKSRLVDDV